MKRFALALLLGFCSFVCLAGPWSGTWTLRGDAPKLTMTIVDAGTGWKVIYKASGTDAQGKPTTYTSTFETLADGKESPHLIDGKPTGQTIAVKKIDERHTVSVLKVEGKQTGISPRSPPMGRRSRSRWTTWSQAPMWARER